MMRNLVLVLRLLVGLLLLSGVAAVSAVAAPGGTGHTVTMTTTLKVTSPIDDVNPCAPADPVVGLSRDHIVVHETDFFESGLFHIGLNDTAKVTMTDHVTGVVYTGHSTFQKSLRLNERSSTGSFSRSMAIKGSDGSTIHFHVNGHFTVNAHGRVTVDFEKVRLTCR
jgi:hypothetical protein